MNLKLEVYYCLCELSKFEINGIIANKNDFGEKYDRDEELAEQYCCGNMQFTGIRPTKEVLEKYKITEEEYHEIVYQLEKKLSFGSCGWCS